MSVPRIRISTVVMHHPARQAALPALLESCADLDPVVVTDPDPEGPPSPLRTAKVAWAAVPHWATHHLVLQDDVHAVPAVGEALRSAVAARADCGIALYVHWHNLPNSYYVRRAVAAGASWAPVCPTWVPTTGLLLPADTARDLAAYLSSFPDELRHDDDVITRFVGAQGIRVLATVPHLVDHVGDASVAGNDEDGHRHAAVFTGRRVDAGTWAEARSTVADLVARNETRTATDHSVHVHDSECRVVLTRPGSGEALEHPFGWYWYDWSAVLGVDADRVLAGCAAPVADAAGRGVPPRLGVEVWAAGYLLGRDVASLPATAPADPELLAAALRSLVRAGPAGPDRPVVAAHADVLSGLAGAGLAAGRADGPPVADGPLDSPAAAGEFASLVRRMAVRDAEAHLMLSSYDVLTRIRVEPVPCPWCGSRPRPDRAWQPPLRAWEPGMDWAPESAGRPTLSVLACERVTVRSLLPVCAAVHRHPATRDARFSTRGAALAESPGHLQGNPLAALRLLDAGERWVDLLLACAEQEPVGEPLIVPGVTRSVPDAADHADPKGTSAAIASVRAPHFLVPHRLSGELDTANGMYRTVRLETVRSALGVEEHHIYDRRLRWTGPRTDQVAGTGVAD